MKVNVKCFPPLSEGDSCNFLDATPYELNPGDRVSDLIGQLDFPVERVSRIFINGEKAIPATCLSEDDRVGLFPFLR